MIKKSLFLGVILGSLTFSSWGAGPRCLAIMMAGGKPGTDYCQLRVDGNDYKKISPRKCVCPSDSELPALKSEGPEIIVAPVEIKTIEKAAIKVQALIDGKKNKSITFNCKSKLVTNVDEEGKPTGLLSCLLMDNDKTVSESRIDDDSEDQAYAHKMCQKCQKKMNIPQGELTAYGMSLLDAVKNPGVCKLISSAVSHDRSFQFCLIDVCGKQQVSYGGTLNECKDACSNNKVVCSLSKKEERNSSQEVTNKIPVSESLMQ